MSKNKIEEIKEDLHTVQDLVVLSETKGGKQLINGLTEDILSSIEGMVNQRETLTIQGFVSFACDIKTKLDVVRAIKNAKTNENLLKELLNEVMAQ